MGIVTIGAKDGSAVTDAQRQIDQILNPPRAEVGDVYSGKVVNITKFGAFVNILPGRDGLLHISKLGRGKRVDRVEDVLELGQEIEVRVDDIDPQGKVALSPLGESNGDAAPSPAGPSGSDEAGTAPAPSAPSGGSDRDYVSFEDTFAAEAETAFGDLGPGEPARAAGGGRGGDRGGDGGAPRRNRSRTRRPGPGPGPGNRR
jgi:polyribonucleotide nucleotidyltransferase